MAARSNKLLFSVGLALSFSSLCQAQGPTALAQGRGGGGSPGRSVVLQTNDGAIYAADFAGLYAFSSWQEYTRSDYFLRNGRRCSAPGMEGGAFSGSSGDCSSDFTNPIASYDPAVTLYRIPVVVHVIMSDSGTGAVSDAMVKSQIDILNEDFLAVFGTNGAPGTDTQVEFLLATEDPQGNPHGGITRTNNTEWFNDLGDYYNTLAWDTNRYLNIYTNTAGGYLGYAYLPTGGWVVGETFDGVRVLWSAFGRNGPIGPPYDQGRTATHEVGHYLGLHHTFRNGCTTPEACASTGDLICDTNPEADPNYYDCSASTCGSVDPVTNYMDYSGDVCMDMFTPYQARRMRCVLENWRVDLAQGASPGNSVPSVTIATPSDGASFTEGDSVSFTASATDTEDGNLSSSIAWSSSLDGALGTGAASSATLSVGNHTVTARATDSGGASGSAGIDVTVNAAPGTGIQLSGRSSKKNRRVRVRLTWSDATTGRVKIYRNGRFIAKTANDGRYLDRTRKRGHGSIRYKLKETGSGGTWSPEITVTY